MLARLDRDFLIGRERMDRERAEDRTAEADRLEGAIRAMRNLMFAAIERRRDD